MKITDIIKIPYYVYKGGIAVIYLILSAAIFGLIGYSMYIFFSKALSHGTSGLIVLVVLFFVGYFLRSRE